MNLNLVSAPTLRLYVQCYVLVDVRATKLPNNLQPYLCNTLVMLPIHFMGGVSLVTTLVFVVSDGCYKYCQWHAYNLHHILTENNGYMPSGEFNCSPVEGEVGRNPCWYVQ